MQAPAEDEIRELYCNRGLPLRALADRYGMHNSDIRKLMIKYGIKRRNRIEAVVRSVRKYSKKPFSGNLLEKAYLMGVAFADFRRRKHGYQIDIALSTTHPAFACLFKKLFETCSPVRERPYYSYFHHRYGWRLETQLDPSFEFLLGKRAIPNWIITNNDRFRHFLAGYTDGEGTISIAKNSKRCTAFIFAIASEDKSIVASIYKKLTELGYKASLRKSKLAGTNNLFYGKTLTYTKDTWTVRIKRKSDVLCVLNILPIRHPEKIQKRELMLRLADKCYLSEVMPEWLALKAEIRAQVGAYLDAAALRSEFPVISQNIANALE